MLRHQSRPKLLPRLQHAMHWSNTSTALAPGGGGAVSADAGTCGNVACWEMAPSWPRLEKKKCVTLLYGSDQRIGAGREGRCRRKERRRGVRQRERERGAWNRTQCNDISDVHLSTLVSLSLAPHYGGPTSQSSHFQFSITNLANMYRLPKDLDNRIEKARRPEGNYICHTEH